jgi:hypothetical protein
MPSAMPPRKVNSPESHHLTKEPPRSIADYQITLDGAELPKDKIRVDFRLKHNRDRLRSDSIPESERSCLFEI